MRNWQEGLLNELDVAHVPMTPGGTDFMEDAGDPLAAAVTQEKLYDLDELCAHPGNIQSDISMEPPPQLHKLKVYLMQNREKVFDLANRMSGKDLKHNMKCLWLLDLKGKLNNDTPDSHHP